MELTSLFSSANKHVELICSVLAHYKEPHGPLGSEDGALRAAGPNEPYEPPDSRTLSEAPFARHKPYLHFSVRIIDASAI